MLFFAIPDKKIFHIKKYVPHPYLPHRSIRLAADDTLYLFDNERLTAIAKTESVRKIVDFSLLVTRDGAFLLLFSFIRTTPWHLQLHYIDLKTENIVFELTYHHVNRYVGNVYHDKKFYFIVDLLHGYEIINCVDIETRTSKIVFRLKALQDESSTLSCPIKVKATTIGMLGNEKFTWLIIGTHTRGYIRVLSCQADKLCYLKTIKLSKRVGDLTNIKAIYSFNASRAMIVTASNKLYSIECTENGEALLIQYDNLRGASHHYRLKDWFILFGFTPGTITQYDEELKKQTLPQDLSKIPPARFILINMTTFTIAQLQLPNPCGLKEWIHFRLIDQDRIIVLTHEKLEKIGDKQHYPYRVNQIIPSSQSLLTWPNQNVTAKYQLL